MSLCTHGVFLDADSIQPDELDLGSLKQAVPDLTFYPHTRLEDAVERIGSAEVVICNKTPMRREVLAAASNLKLITVAATGINNVDLTAATELGIVVCNARGYSTQSVVQVVFSMILGLMTRLSDYQGAVSFGVWQQSQQFCALDFPFSELHGKRIGIVGYGAIGRAVEQVGEAFGMESLIAERRGVTEVRENRIAFEDVLAQADVLTLHCPFTPETNDLIAEKEIALMKPSALLINAARGGVVNEAALRDALKQGRIGGAGVDVLTNEPPTDGNPLLDPSIPNLIITPHIAWASREARQRLVDRLAENIQAFNAGTPKNVVSL
ncbi:MAG TPA: D-2-hydroxyacid dehydrogenase [Nitrospirales bacterium]|nr:D-2-hydroxyacid dehydrogenase [Nitrospirales bacterium]